MTLTLQHVSRDKLPEVWPALEEVLREHPETWAGEYELPKIYDRLCGGLWQWWVLINEDLVVQFSLLTRVIQLDLGDSLEVIWGAGVDPRYVVGAMPHLEDLALRMGCREVRIAAARMGWLKLLEPYGFSYGYSVFGKTLIGPGKGH